MRRIGLEELKELRRRTGAGVLRCRHALETAEGNMEHAEDLLRAEARAEAERRAGHVSEEGAVGSYIHHTGKLGALVEVTCETDFVGRTAEFRELVAWIAEQVAAAGPSAIDEASAPAGTNPRETALLAQPWIREPSRTVGELLAETAARVGERLEIRRFSRFHLGET